MVVGVLTLVDVDTLLDRLVLTDVDVLVLIDFEVDTLLKNR